MSSRSPVVAWVLLAIALWLGLEILCLGPLRRVLWGSHIPVYLPRPLILAGWAVVLSAAVVLARRPAPPARFPARLRALRIVRGSRPLTALVTGAAAGLWFWLLRSRQDLLGDAVPLIRDLPHGLAHHPRQPLTQALQQGLYRWLSPLWSTGGDGGLAPHELAARTVALGSVLCGIAFVFLVRPFARELAAVAAPSAGEEREDGATSAWFAALLLTQGWTLLFYGYLENYTFVALALAAHATATLAWLRGRLGLWPSALLLATATALHVASVLALPAWLAVVAWRLARTARRGPVLRDLAVGLAFTAALGGWLQHRAGDYSWAGAVGRVLGLAREDQGGGQGLRYLLSLVHLNDWWNEQVLLGPISALALLVALLVWVLRRPTRPRIGLVYLWLAGASVAAAHFGISEPALGYARDWDLFAPSAILVTAAALATIGSLLAGPVRPRVLALLLLLSVWHTGTWIALNTSAERSAARFADLPLGLGRTEVVLGNWHLRRGRPQEAERWFRRALLRNPLNNNACALLAALRARAGDFDRASEWMERAVEIRPRKPEYRQRLVALYDEAQRPQDAVEALRDWLRLDPGSAERWWELARREHALGRPEQAREALTRARSLMLDRWQQGTRSAEDALRLGDLAAGVGDLDDARNWYRQARELDPGLSGLEERLRAVDAGS